jgi:hypothetical protein
MVALDLSLRRLDERLRGSAIIREFIRAVMTHAELAHLSQIGPCTTQVKYVVLRGLGYNVFSLAFMLIIYS